MRNEEGKSIAAVICAAGASKRMGGVKKEYLKIDNTPQSLTVLGSCVQTFSSIDNVDIIAVAIPQNDEDAAHASIPADFFLLNKPKLIFVKGGDTRQASVYNALCALKESNPDYVLIHDGARPFASGALVKNVLCAAQEHGAAIPVLALADTPKEHCGGFVTRHLKRADTGAAQTPQGFLFKEIFAAHEKALNADEEFTDDAEIWGRYIGNVAVVPGEAANRKITFKEDLL